MIEAQSTVRRWLLTYARATFDRESILSIDGVEIIYLHVVAALLILGWIGLVLGEIGLFSLPRLGVLTLIITVGSYVVLRRAPFNLPIRWSTDLLVIIPVLVVATTLFTPPFEFIRGGADPGVYVNTAANIAHTGSILVVDREMAELSAATRSALFREPPQPFTYGSRMEGFYIADLDQGVVVPHGFHLYPIVLAIAYSGVGVWGSLWATPAIALVALVGFFLLVRRLFGVVVALLAAIFLIANPAMIWFARYPAAENLVLLWLFGGFLAFVLMMDTRYQRFAVVAGLALGAVHLTKIELILLPVVLGSFFYLQWLLRRWRAEYWWFLVCYLLMLFHALLHAWFISTWYAYSIIVRSISSTYVVGAMLGIVVLCLMLLFRTQVARILASDVFRNVGSVGATLGILSLAAYAYYVRPQIGNLPGPVAELSPLEQYWWANSRSLESLGWYVAPAGLLLGLLGYVAALVRMRTMRVVPILTLALVETTWLLNESRITPVHFWAARRFVPVVFPMFALFTAYMLWRLQVILRGRWPESIAPAALGTVILVSCLGGWYPFRDHVEYRGAVEQFAALAAYVPNDSVVLFDHSDVGRQLATPFQFIWGKPSFILWKPADEDNTAGQLIAEWLAQGHRVYWVRSNAPPDVERWGFEPTLVASAVVDLPTVLATIDRRPDTIGVFRSEVNLYEIVPTLTAQRLTDNSGLNGAGG